MPKINKEEKLQRLSADYIYQQSVGSLFLLLISAMEEEEKDTSLLPFPLPSEVTQIQEEIRRQLLSLEETLNGDTEMRIDTLTRCLNQKKELLAIYETIYSYFSQWNVISTLVSDQISLRKFKEEDVAKKQIEWPLFFSDCLGFMESAETVLEQKKYMGSLLACLPISMTRDNYFDQVTRSLEASFTGESKEFIEASLKAFECFCCPEANPRYGKYYEEIANWFGTKKMVLPHKLSDEELQEMFEELGDYFEILTGIEESFACIFHDLNSLILLCYLTYSFQDLTEKDVTYSDLYHAVCEFIGGEWTEIEKTAYLDRINEQLENAIEPAIDRANEIGKEKYALLQKMDAFESFHEDTKKILMMEEFIRDCFFGDLNDELFRFDLPKDLPMATKEERQAPFVPFLAKTRSNFDTLPAQTRKVAMQTLLSALPPVCTVEDVMERLHESVDFASSAEQKILIVDKVGMIFSEFGYETITDEALEREQLLAQEHTHHDHDCGCGHDHHGSHDHHH